VTRRKTSIDEPGFAGYLGGDRWHEIGPQPFGAPQRAMFEFMPHNEDCVPGCPKCKRARERAGVSGPNGSGGGA